MLNSIAKLYAQKPTVNCRTLNKKKYNFQPKRNNLVPRKRLKTQIKSNVKCTRNLKHKKVGLFRPLFRPQSVDCQVLPLPQVALVL